MSAPAGTREDPWTAVRTSVDVSGYHLVALAVGSQDDPVPEGSHVPDQYHMLLSPSDALDLARQLINSATPQMENLVDSASRGECDTCNNLRMVTVVKHGRDCQEHCPACSAPLEPTLRPGRRPAPPVPTPPNWAERERRVLGR